MPIEYAELKEGEVPVEDNDFYILSLFDGSFSHMFQRGEDILPGSIETIAREIKAEGLQKIFGCERRRRDEFERRIRRFAKTNKIQISSKEEYAPQIFTTDGVPEVVEKRIRRFVKGFDLTMKNYGLQEKYFVMGFKRYNGLPDSQLVPTPDELSETLRAERNLNCSEPTGEIIY